MQICEWFNSSTIHIQNFISSPFDFNNNKTPSEYNGVLSSIKKSNNNFNLKLFDQPFVNNDEIICSHKYLIVFNDEQQSILKDYYKECKKVYDLCVDIWSDYKNCTCEWRIFKDTIFEYLYRNFETKNLPIDQIKLLIINKLKKIQTDYDLKNNKNKELINKLKNENKELYKKEMEK